MSTADVSTVPLRSVTTPSALSAFASDVFGHLPRSDQRRWAEAYLCGMLTVPGKKTIRRIARGVSPCPGAPHALQQFISASPWDWTTARETLARAAAAHLPHHIWTTGVTFIEKRGEHSVGVHRRFVPGAGRTLNCQVGIGLFLTSEDESIPVDWRLLVDETWSGDAVRRRRARLPESVGAAPDWALVLELVDRLAALRLSGRTPFVADLQPGMDTAQLALQLGQRQQDFVLEVRQDQPVVPDAPQSPGEPTRGRPLGAHQLMAHLAAHRPHVVSTERLGPGRHADVLSTPARLPGGPGGWRLLAEVSSVSRRPVRYWLTSLAHQRTSELLTLIRRLTLTRTAVQSLEDDYGVLDFEGRSFPGWHHHMTLSTAAYVYRRMHENDNARRGAA
ncbi:IS701 family transposase [Streptomyces sp. NPDC088147]|uniref:IS701 family transposase n=1 Tax=unclassified Streptomyces TaxID=2593676 RepID=UPI00339DC66E